MTKKEAIAYTGGLSSPSKMPCKAWGIPVWACNIGSILKDKKESVCSKCYAGKGFFTLSNVKQAYELRLDRWEQHHISGRWQESMSVLIKREKCKYFRWFDSGDLVGKEMLTSIFEVAEMTPSYKHWLPTKEYALVKPEQTGAPSNVVIRVSAPIIEGKPPIWARNTSTVVRQKASCPAQLQENKCLQCRKCWNKRTKNVSYQLH